VVVTRLPAVDAWQDCMDVTEDAGQFATQVLARLDGVTPEAQRRARLRLADESWRAKSERLAEILFGREAA
jgi:hypothetical protein